MARPRLPRIKADRVFLRGREISWRKAWGMKTAGKPVPRGVLVRPGRPPSRTLKQLYVQETPNRIYIPRWRTRKDGTLEERPDRIGVADYPTAIRVEFHKLQGERNANLWMLRVNRAVGLIHGRVVDSWNEMTDREREQVWRHIGQIRRALKGGRAVSAIDSKDRGAAVKRLERLLETRRQGNIASTLVGVANDMTARTNVLAAQMAFTPRLRKALTERKEELDGTAFELLDEVSQYREAIYKGVPAKGEARRDLMKRLRALRSALDARPEPELMSRAAGHVDTALKAMSKNDNTKAVKSLRKGARAILASNARYSWLLPSRLEQVSKSRSSEFKNIIARRQLELFRDNLVYWHSPDSLEPLKPRDIRNLMLHVGELVPETDMHDAADKAAQLLGRGKIRTAKEVLEGVVGKRGD
jgi:hypothetical protein